MEYDRYQVNRTLFLIGIVCLILSLALILFSAFIFPFLLFGWIYDVPEFVIHWLHWFEDELRWSHNLSAWALFLIFFIPGIIAGIISYYSANRIDDEIYHMTPEQEEVKALKPKARNWASYIFGFKILFLIVLVFILAEIIAWLIHVEPPPLP